MRVIAGTLRRRTLEAPAGLKTRPTSDRLRETLFNILAPRIEGARFLDLYAGSGAVGIEAVSRGAAKVVLVERAEPALKVLRENLEKLGLRGAVRVEGVSVGRSSVVSARRLRRSCSTSCSWTRLTRRSMSTRQRWASWAVMRQECWQRKPW